MKFTTPSKILSFSAVAVAAPLALIFSHSVMAQDAANQTSAESQTTIEAEITADIAQAAAVRRAEIVEEAVEALAETKAALNALDNSEPEQALDSLALASGQLQVLLAREPNLGMAATDVGYRVTDVVSTVDGVETLVDTASNALDDGRVQEARKLLDSLASEMVISVSSLPMASYPDAIRDVVPMIQLEHYEKAKQSLQATLNTQVVQEFVIPLPVARAGVYVNLAEELAEKPEASDTEIATLQFYLRASRQELEMAEALGYGDERTFSQLYSQLDGVESVAEDEWFDGGFFEDFRESLDSLIGSL